MFMETITSNLDIIPTCDFLLIIIIVTGGEELSKDKSRHIDLLHLVLHHRNTLAIVPYTDGVVFTEMKSTQSFYLATLGNEPEHEWWLARCLKKYRTPVVRWQL